MQGCGAEWRMVEDEGGKRGRLSWFASSPSDVVILQKGSIDYVPRFSTFGKLCIYFSLVTWLMNVNNGGLLHSCKID